MKKRRMLFMTVCLYDFFVPAASIYRRCKIVTKYFASVKA